MKFANMSVLRRESTDDEDRGISKFYSKIQDYMDKIELPPGESKRYRDVPEDQIYGNVTKEQFLKILDSYDVSQASQLTKDKAVTCDRVDGKSYAKVLFSKVGFHNPESTNHLTAELGIADINRNSFLGGYSTYEVNSGESIAELKQERHKRLLMRMLGDAEVLLRQGESDRAEPVIEEAMKINQTDPETQRVKGLYLFCKNDYSNAIAHYKTALDYGGSQDIIYPHLAEAYHQRGLKDFFLNRFEPAKKDFEGALVYQPGHEGAELHLKHCITRLRNIRHSRNYHYR